MTVNEVRIISGLWRGRKLRFPDDPALRPTLGRVRETLFNWLAARIAGSRCLDLFAGSGALGFEALSRGAARVTFVDSGRRTVRCLHENAARLGAEPARVEIGCMTAERFLRQSRSTWDIVFLDPPFHGDALERALTALARGARLAPEGVVYFEMPRRGKILPGDWEILKEATAGDTRFGLLATREAGRYHPAVSGGADQ
jgi:16S rRNA (guanine966-N2)-methyltransferase